MRIASAPYLPLWPFAVYFGFVMLLVIAILVVSALLGQRHRQRATDIPYESGMLPTGSARVRLAADYYLVAMFFVIFDLESVFLYAWAITGRDVGWWGFGEMVVFVLVLLGALSYLWQIGALDWGTSAHLHSQERWEDEA